MVVHNHHPIRTELNSLNISEQVKDELNDDDNNNNEQIDDVEPELTDANKFIVFGEILYIIR